MVTINFSIDPNALVEKLMRAPRSIERVWDARHALSSAPDQSDVDHLTDEINQNNDWLHELTGVIRETADTLNDEMTALVEKDVALSIRMDETESNISKIINYLVEENTDDGQEEDL